MSYTRPRYTSKDYTLICTCGHTLGKHTESATASVKDKCTICKTCPRSASEVFDQHFPNGRPTPPSAPKPKTDLERIEEKLDTIIAWMAEERLEKMEKELS